MMQSCASAAKLRSGGPILPIGMKAKGHVGNPPPRTIIGVPSQTYGQWGFFSQEVFMQSGTSFSFVGFFVRSESPFLRPHGQATSGRLRARWRRLGGRDDDQRGARFRARFNRATTLYSVGPRT